MTKRTLIQFIIGFFILWTIAWLLHQFLVIKLGIWSKDQSGIELAYWVVMKLIVWLGFPAVYWCTKIPNIAEFIGLSRATLKRGYQWGIVATLVWVGLSLALVPLLHRHLSGIEGSLWTYIYIITITPIVEEIVFRGFILSGLVALKTNAKKANVITTALFLLIHFLGWTFQGTLITNLASTTWVSIALFSMVAGYVRIHSGSLRSSILLHMGNNTIAGFVK